MKIMMGSEHPSATTGYGNVTNELTRRWAKDHEVFIVAWQHVVNPVQIDKNLTILPTDPLQPPGGWGIWKHHIKQYKPDLVITLIDIWFTEPIAKACSELGIPYFNYFPVDSIPFSRQWDKALQLSTQGICMSNFGRDTVAEHFKGTLFEDEYANLPVIYHGVDANTFKPLSDKDRKRLRLQFECPGEPFVILQVNRNVQRKNIPGTYEALKIFLGKLNEEERKNIFYLQKVGLLNDDKNGYDLEEIIRELGIGKHIINLDKVQSPLAGMSREELANIYSMADISVSGTCAEGFGLSTAESLSCETPIIITDYSTSMELVENRGWLVNVGGYWRGKYNVKMAIMNPEHMAECMMDAYLHKDKRIAFGKAGREFMLNYTWDKIAKQFIDLFEMMI